MVDFTKPCQIGNTPVRVICTDAGSSLPVIAINERGTIYRRMLDGTSPGTRPIINTPAPRISRFSNVSKELPWGYTTRADADRNRDQQHRQRAGVLEYIYEGEGLVDVVLHKDV